MKPFSFNAEANAKLVERYPQANGFAYSFKALPKDGRDAIVRSFITEGIPYAFQQTPLLYEMARDFVAGQLGIEARQVTMIGSARIGYSLAPPPSYGLPFGAESDLDFTVFSKTLFDGLVSDFSYWERDLATGQMKRTGASRERFWDENLQLVPQNIKRGFIDPYKIPNNYDGARNISQTLWTLQEKLKATEGAPKARHVSMRVYENWRAYARQQSLNLGHCLRNVKV